jgi:hypothetical protein
MSRTAFVEMPYSEERRVASLSCFFRLSSRALKMATAASFVMMHMPRRAGPALCSAASGSWRADADPPFGGIRGHRVTPSLRHAFLSAVGEMPSARAAFPSVVLQNLPMVSRVILTGALPLLICPSLRRGMTVEQPSAFGGPEGALMAAPPVASSSGAIPPLARFVSACPY